MNTTTTAAPSVLVIGFDETGLESRFAGKVSFMKPVQVRSPADLQGIVRMIISSGPQIFNRDRERLSSLAATNANLIVEHGSGTTDLVDRLGQLFPDPPPIPSNGGAPPHDDPAETNEGLAKIRALQIDPGSATYWTQQRMRYPCSVTAEVTRLMALMPTEGVQFKEGAIKQALYSLMRRAGLMGKNDASAPLPPMDPDAAASEVRVLMTDIQALMDGEIQRHAHVVGVLREFQTRVRRFEADSAVITSLRSENETLRRDLGIAQTEGREAKILLDGIRRKLQM